MGLIGVDGGPGRAVRHLPKLSYVAKHDKFLRRENPVPRAAGGLPADPAARHAPHYRVGRATGASNLGGGGGGHGNNHASATCYAWQRHHNIAHSGCRGTGSRVVRTVPAGVMFFDGETTCCSFANKWSGAHGALAEHVHSRGLAYASDSSSAFR